MWRYGRSFDAIGGLICKPAYGVEAEEILMGWALSKSEVHISHIPRNHLEFCESLPVACNPDALVKMFEILLIVVVILPVLVRPENTNSSVTALSIPASAYW